MGFFNIKKIILLLTLVIFLSGCKPEERITEKITEKMILPERVGSGEIVIDGAKFDFKRVTGGIILNEPYDYTTSVSAAWEERVIAELSFSIVTELTKELSGKYTTQDLYGDAPAVEASVTWFKDNKIKVYADSVWNEETQDYEEGSFEVTITKFERKEGADIAGSFKGTLINKDDLNDKIEISGTFSGAIGEVS